MKKNVHIQPYHDKGERIRIEGENQQIVEAVRELLKPQLIELVEQAFTDYCNKHGADNETRNREWRRFKSCLIRKL